MPKLEANIIDVTPSNIAFVNKRVLFPFKALSIGPNIDIVPIQNKSTAVVSPCAKFPLDTFFAKL